MSSDRTPAGAGGGPSGGGSPEPGTAASVGDHPVGGTAASAGDHLGVGPGVMRALVRASLVLACLVVVPGLLECFESPKTGVVWICAAAAGAWLAVAAVLARRRGLLPVFHLLDLAVLFWIAVEALCTVLAVSTRLAILGEHFQREGFVTSVSLAVLYFASRYAHGSAPAQRLSSPEVSPAAALGANAEELRVAAEPAPGANAEGLRVAAEPVRAAWRTLDAVLAAGALSCLYALLQAAKLDPLHWSRAATYGPGGALVRPFGTLGHPNLLGVACAGFACVAVGRAIARRDRLWLDGPAALTFTVAAVLTFSRGAWLGLFVGLTVTFWLAQRARLIQPSSFTSLPRKWVWTIAVAALAVLVVFGTSGWGRLFAARIRDSGRPATGSMGARIEIWHTAVRMWQASPWWGQGPDCFALRFPMFQTPEYWRREWGGVAYHAHDVYLHVLATRGVLGLIAIAGLAMGFLWAAHRICQRYPLLPYAGAGGSLVAASSNGGQPALLIPATVGAAVAVAAAGGFGALGVMGCVLLATQAGILGGVLGERVPMPRSLQPGGRSALPVYVLGAAAAALAAASLVISTQRVSYYAAGARAKNVRGAPAALQKARRGATLAPRDDVMQLAYAQLALTLAANTPSPRLLLQEAETAARRAVAAEPLRADNHERLAQVLAARAALGEADPADAYREFDRALELAPVGGDVMVERSRAELVHGRSAAAATWAERALALYPNDAPSWAALAAARRAQGDSTAMRAALDRAIQSDWHEQAFEEQRVRAWRASLEP